MNEENLIKGVNRLKRRRDTLLDENTSLKKKIAYLEFRVKHTENMLKREREYREASK